MPSTIPEFTESKIAGLPVVECLFTRASDATTLSLHIRTSDGGWSMLKLPSAELAAAIQRGLSDPHSETQAYRVEGETGLSIRTWRPNRNAASALPRGLETINWRGDKRKRKPADYAYSPDDRQNRLNTFLAGWIDQLNRPGSFAQDVTWKNLGRVYASILGDLPVQSRRDIYALLLRQFVHGPQTRHWSDADREIALRHFPLIGVEPSHPER